MRIRFVTSNWSLATHTVVIGGVRFPKKSAALLLVLAFAATAHAEESKNFDWLPTAIFAPAVVADQWSTHRFLTNGSLCQESNPTLGKRPGDVALTAHSVGVVGTAVAVQFLAHRILRGHKAVSIGARMLALAGATVVGEAAVRNVVQCPARTR
jgi:hypothetical protein